MVVVYELLEEMLDNGFPLATESNILKELIKPPTILRTMVNTITGSSAILYTLYIVGKQKKICFMFAKRPGIKIQDRMAIFQ